MSEVLSTQANRTAVASLLNVHKTYAGNRRGVSGINLDLFPGEIVGFVGANGSGKTTLLHILAGLVKPDSGQVALFGNNVTPIRNRELKNSVGFASQDPALDPEMKVTEILELFCAIYGILGHVGRRPDPHNRNKKSEIEKIITDFGLDEFCLQPIARLSGGQRQRVHLAILFLQKPTLLLLDEPTNALDPDGQTRLWNMLKICRSNGSTVVIATHQLHDAENHFDRVALFSGGQIISLDTPTNLQEKHDVALAQVSSELNSAPAPGRGQGRGQGQGRGRGRSSWA